MNKKIVKYNFLQFIAACESNDFDVIEESKLEWATEFIHAFPVVMQSAIHCGDCINLSAPCPICIYETMLADYYEYYFNETNWRMNNA
jgi:hypothetical protein